MSGVGKNTKGKSVNILVTLGMIKYIDNYQASSTAEATREVVGAFIVAHKSGEVEVTNRVNDIARRTSASKRKAYAGKKKITWSKKVIWIPEDMNADIESICENDIRVADFIRGAIAIAAGVDPYPEEVQEEQATAV